MFLQSVMATKDNELQYLALKSMFDSNNIKKMRDIEKLYPTMIATDMGMNHGRYIKKIHNPEEFTIKEICKLASLLQISPSIITNIILAELSSRPKRGMK